MLHILGARSASESSARISHYCAQTKKRCHEWQLNISHAWLINTVSILLNEEQEYLRNLGLRPEDVKVLHTAQVVARLHKTVCLYNVPASCAAAVQTLEQEAKISGWNQYWQKTIESNTLSSSEYNKLSKIPGIRITVT